jgi:hypothetical protein
MSDMGLPFDEAPDTGGGAGGQRKKVILLAAVAVLLVLLAVFVVPKLLGGSKPVAKPAAAASSKAGKTPAKKPAKKKPAAKAVKKKPKPFNASIGRDPFKPLYVPLSEKAKAGDGTPSPTATKAPGGTPTSNNGVFKLISVKGTGAIAKATVTFNGVQYPDVVVGRPFADGKFKLTLVTASGCAEFTYGEMPFSLCLAQTVTFTGF